MAEGAGDGRCNNRYLSMGAKAQPPIILARGADKEDFPALRQINLLERAQALVAARLALAF